MSTELTTPGANELDVIIRQAKLLAESTIVPRDYQRSPGNVVAAALMGRAFGWDAMTSMRMVTVIQGTASLKPEAQLALIRQRGHSVRIEQHADGKGVTVHGQRRDTGDTASATFTLADAERAGLLRNGTWKAYPLDMCQWRAISRLSRQLFGDVVLGAGYSPEEIALASGDVGSVEVLRDGSVAEIETTRSAPAPRTPEQMSGQTERVDIDLTARGIPEEHREAIAAALGTTLEIIEDGEIVEDKPIISERRASSGQIGKVVAIGHSVGIHDTPTLLLALSALLRREITDLDDVRFSEVDAVFANDGDGLLRAHQEIAPLPADGPDDPWGSTTALPTTAEQATKPQLAKLGAAFSAVGITDKTERRDYCIAVINRPIDSAADMTKAEASKVIDALTKDN